MFYNESFELEGDLTHQLHTVDWGLIPYSEALQKQLDLLEKVHSENQAGVIVFCTHPPIVTLGSATQESDVFAWNGETVQVTRGGRATYHGPSQIVVYPIVNLNHPRGPRKAREIHGFLRSFEQSIVDCIATYGLQTTGKSLQKKNPQLNQAAEETGVWLNERKIASLGIGIKKWISFHGAAINLQNDPAAFAGINPCGFSSSVMISLEEALQAPVDRQEFIDRLKNILLLRL